MGLGDVEVAALATLVAACTVVGCGRETVSLEVPEASTVALIQATGEDRKGSAFRNREGIEHVRGVLVELAPEMQPTTEALPAMHYSASLSSADNTILFVLWVGEDWLAANDMRGQPNFRRQLVDPEREKLLRGLGVGPYFDAVDP